jgi:hypothetical protein
MALEYKIRRLRAAMKRRERLSKQIWPLEQKLRDLQTKRSEESRLEEQLSNEICTPERVVEELKAIKGWSMPPNIGYLNVSLPIDSAPDFFRLVRHRGAVRLGAAPHVMWGPLAVSWMLTGDASKRGKNEWTHVDLRIYIQCTRERAISLFTDYGLSEVLKAFVGAEKKRLKAEQQRITKALNGSNKRISRKRRKAK